MKLYKLTDANGQTYGGTQWGENVTHTASGHGFRFCTSEVIHAYESPEVAVFMNPVHADFSDPLLWEAKGDVVVREGQLKCGVKSLITLKQIPLPDLTTNHRVAIGILIAISAYKDEKFAQWATSWLSGKDRSSNAATAAKAAAYAAAAKAAATAAKAAATAAKAAAYAAAVAADAAYYATKATYAATKVCANLIDIIEEARQYA